MTGLRTKLSAPLSSLTIIFKDIKIRKLLIFQLPPSFFAYYYLLMIYHSTLTFKKNSSTGDDRYLHVYEYLDIKTFALYKKKLLKGSYTCLNLPYFTLYRTE